MDTALFLKSVLLGLAIAAPLGPIGALCINRTLERGFIAGAAGGLGAALADGVYATLAAVGLGGILRGAGAD
ncbi:LysE family transporter [Ponticoccus litoralis]|uniref:LysE family transporter n=1 Tax=Ponticoccus litoralis TaxID=422297 RepID=A0AAW9SGJ4_9RHOB